MASTSGTIELRDHYSSHPQNSRQIRPHPSDENSTATTAVDVSFLRRSATVVVLAGVTANGPLCNGILTVALPSVAKDIKLSSNLILWPASVFGLAAGCTLLIFGSLADVVGAKRIWLTGISLYTVFTLGCGLVQTGLQIIIFRVVTGIALAMCLPTSVGIITKAFPPGKGRNTAFSIIGVSQPFGFSVGLVAGGAFVNTIGWRSGFYISAALAAILIPGGFWALPVDDSWGPSNWVRLRTEIDWVGASLISIAFAIISYVLG